MVSIDGTNITGATIDGQQVSEITIGGQTAWTAIPDSVVNNLDVWWPLDEGSGTVLTDALVNATASFPAGDWRQNVDYWGNTATEMDGVDNYWNSDNKYALNDGGDATVVGWVKADTSQSNHIVGADDIVAPGESPATSASGGGWAFIFDGDSSTYRLSTYGSIDGGAVANNTTGPDVTQTKVFFSVNIDGLNGSTGSATIRMYDKNGKVGQATGSQTYSENHDTTSSSYLMSGSMSGLYLDGVLDAVGFNESVSLTETKIEQIWADTV